MHIVIGVCVSGARTNGNRTQPNSTGSTSTDAFLVAGSSLLFLFFFLCKRACAIFRLLRSVLCILRQRAMTSERIMFCAKQQVMVICPAKGVW
jgi:hypothetical protein